MAEAEHAELKRRFRDNPKAIAKYLTDALSKNDIAAVLAALNDVLRAQNVLALARDAGMRRDRLYKTFGGSIDPQFSRVIKLLEGLNVKLIVVPLPPKPRAPRPKLGRPRKPRIIPSSKSRP
jgi:probable addiction module antidote protein